MAPCRQHPASLLRHQTVYILKMQLLLPSESLIHRLCNGIICGSSQNRVHLFDFIQDFLLVPLSQAACDNQGLAASAFAVFSHLQNRIDTFFLGVAYKAAGIDYDNICFCLIVRELISFLFQELQHHLGIHQVFIAAKRYK